MQQIIEKLNMQRVVDRFDELMGQPDPLDDNKYWANLFGLAFLTISVLLYLLTPQAAEVQISFETILVFLVVSGYSLILFNQIELLRTRIVEMGAEMEEMHQ
jgi:hypothetical protein